MGNAIKEDEDEEEEKGDYKQKEEKKGGFKESPQRRDTIFAINSMVDQFQ